jgi:hypothetical protein
VLPRGCIQGGHRIHIVLVLFFNTNKLGGGENFALMFFEKRSKRKNLFKEELRKKAKRSKVHGFRERKR